jgi:hypothetical protein
VTEGAAAATGEALRSAAMATEPQQAVTASVPQQVATAMELRQAVAATEPRQAAVATVAITAMAVTALSTSPMPAPAGSPRAAVVEVPDDDVPPLGWDQWVSLPTSAPEPLAGALVTRGMAA